MKAHPEDVQSIMAELNHQLSTGWLYYLSAKHLHSAYETKRVACSRYFLLASYHATIDQSIHRLQGIVGKSGPGSFSQLMEAISGDGQPAESIAQNREALQSLAGRLNELSSAAQARKVFTLQQDPDDDEPVLTLFPPAQLEELGQCYREATRLANVYQAYLKNNPLDYLTLEEDVADDVNFMMELMGGGCI